MQRNLQFYYYISERDLKYIDCPEVKEPSLCPYAASPPGKYTGGGYCINPLDSKTVEKEGIFDNGSLGEGDVTSILGVDCGLSTEENVSPDGLTED